MTSLTVHAIAGVSVLATDGTAPRNGNPLTNALWGDAFSWEVPNNLVLTFGAPSNVVTLNFDDSNGVLTDDPYNSANVVDQRLTAPVTINGKTYAPSSSTIRWQYPPPVTVEDEYHVTLFDAAGNAYTMVAVSITVGYTTTVVGVTFLGQAPPEGTPLYYLQGQSSYTGNGQSAPIPDLTTTPGTAVCFLRGTRIDTPDGPRAIQDLAEGDLVTTLDHGPQPIRWIGSSRVAAQGALAPIRIAAGHLGNDRPLWVSPNHRLLLRGLQAELLFGEDEVLVPAKFLLDDARVTRRPQTEVEYFHLLLDRHEILLAEGAPAESLHLGQQSLLALGAEARAEIAAIFPGAPWSRNRLSRRSLTRPEARVLLAA